MSRIVYVELRAAAERAGLDLRAVGAALRIATEVEIYSVPIVGMVGPPPMAPPYAPADVRARRALTRHHAARALWAPRVRTCASARAAPI